MKAERLLKAMCVTVTAAALLLQSVPVSAAAPTPELDPAPSANQHLPPTIDIALGAGGRLHGFLVNPQGLPLTQASVVIRQQQKNVAVATSDRLGQFAVRGLRGGTYELIVGQHAARVRAWTAGAAPPHARPVALVVVSDPIVRGQMPLENFFSSDAFVVTGLVAAAIAIPIVAHNSGHSRPHSP